MIAVALVAPDVVVQPQEYLRLLGYPGDRTFEGRSQELADMARAWYGEHGRPWTYTRPAASLDIRGDAAVIDGVEFTCTRLRDALRDARADHVMLVAASAGPELECEAQQRWRADKPDEYYFLECYGSAVVEQLVTDVGARLCANADARGLAVLPHYSPGYPGWSIVEQGALLEVVRPPGTTLPGPIDALESGMLRPKKSLLAVFGITAETGRVRALTELVPCDSCSLPHCSFRRATYARARSRTMVEA